MSEYEETDVSENDNITDMSDSDISVNSADIKNFLFFNIEEKSEIERKIREEKRNRWRNIRDRKKFTKIIHLHHNYKK